MPITLTRAGAILGATLAVVGIITASYNFTVWIDDRYTDNNEMQAFVDKQNVILTVMNDNIQKHSDKSLLLFIKKSSICGHNNSDSASAQFASTLKLLDISGNQNAFFISVLFTKYSSSQYVPSKCFSFCFKINF